MFIRTTKTGIASGGSARLSHRPVENRHRDGKVRQATLLNLGRHCQTMGITAPPRNVRKTVV